MSSASGVAVAVEEDGEEYGGDGDGDEEDERYEEDVKYTSREHVGRHGREDRHGSSGIGGWRGG